MPDVFPARHVGRSFPGLGNPIERTCVCPKEPCGLVDEDAAEARGDCEEHGGTQTMRQRHRADECPGAAARDPYAASPDAGDATACKCHGAWHAFQQHCVDWPCPGCDYLCPREEEEDTSARGGVDVEAVRARERAASKEVARLCEGGAWRMAVPVEPGRDSDLIINAALADMPALIAEVERLTRERDQTRGWRRAAEERDQLRRALRTVVADPDQVGEHMSLSAIRRLAGLEEAPPRGERLMRTYARPDEPAQGGESGGQS